ncbi:MAG TPA: DUF4352 domain-containing protein [Bryobacteraceae bacterium]
MALLAGIATLSLCFSGCTPGKSGGVAHKFRMGEHAQAGTLIYTVLDTEWLDQLGQPPDVKLPQHRFLAVRMSITNSGAAPAGVPRAALVGASGTRYEELENASGLSAWLGYIRSVNPADTLHGRVVFDAPPSDYQLMLSSSAGDADDGAAVLVALPLQFTQPRAGFLSAQQ